MDRYKPNRETEVPIDAQQVPALWEHLSKLKPVESGGSFHVSDSKYVFEGKTYLCFWILTSKTTSDCPYEIYEIVTLTKDQIKYPKGFQLDLFYDQ